MDKLTPLTAEQSAEFERNRHSANVVQHKCTCGTWYENDRGPEDYQVNFPCEVCNHPVSFSVPKLEVKSPILKPTNTEVILTGDPDQRLDTGMKVKEAIQRAAAWWELKGAKEMQTQLLRQAKPAGGADNGAGGSFVSKDSANPSFLPSGLLQGRPWDALTKREKLMVVKTWHHFHIRNPDLLDGDAEARFKMQDRKEIE